MKHRWTLRDKVELRKLRARKATLEEQAEHLGRSRSAVCQHAIRAMRLHPLRRRKKFWTDDEVGYLIEHMPVMTMAAIAVELDRTAQSVRDKAKTLNLYRRDNPL